jgi:hypothetical protein
MTKLFLSMPSWTVAAIQPGYASDWTGCPEVRCKIGRGNAEKLTRLHQISARQESEIRTAKNANLERFNYFCSRKKAQKSQEKALF